MEIELNDLSHVRCAHHFPFLFIYVPRTHFSFDKDLSTLSVQASLMDLYKVGTILLCRWQEEGKPDSWLPAKIVKIPPPGQHGGTWQVHWMTGDPDGSTFEPWYTDLGDIYSSTVVNESDFKRLPNVVPRGQDSSERTEPRNKQTLTPKMRSGQPLNGASFVWRYFTEPKHVDQWKGNSAMVAYCCIESGDVVCSIGYKYLGSPQPLKTHIMTKHPDIFKKETAICSGNEITCMTKVDEIRQRSDPFTNAKKAAEVALKKNHPTYMRALDAVSNWVATRCLPIQVACSDEFHAVMQTLDTKMPKIRQEEVRSCILQHYEDAKVNLKAICPMRVATTIDFWSRLDRKGFGTVTVHFITKNWELQEKVLGAKSLDAMIGIDEDDTDFQIPHETAENIGQFYCGMLERVGLKPHTNTTDAPSVMELLGRAL